MPTLPDDTTVTDCSLATQGLVAGYSDIPVVRGVDIEVTAGRVVAVVGPNGAGKSTLLKAILGLIPVMGGSVTLDGANVTGQPLERLARRGIAYVPQVNDGFDTLKVIENLEMGGYLLSKAKRRERIEEVLDVFPSLRPKLSRYVGVLSVGERKMTAIARALMLAPRIFVLDEPTAGLSPTLTSLVFEDQVRVLANRGKGVLLVEQRAQLALAVADWGYVLVQGSTAMSAPAHEVLHSPAMAEIFLGGGGTFQNDPSASGRTS